MGSAGRGTAGPRRPGASSGLNSAIASASGIRRGGEKLAKEKKGEQAATLRRPTAVVSGTFSAQRNILRCCQMFK